MALKYRQKYLSRKVLIEEKSEPSTAAPKKMKFLFSR